MVLILKQKYQRLRLQPFGIARVSYLRMFLPVVTWIICCSHMFWLVGKDQHMMELFLKQRSMQDSRFLLESTIWEMQILVLHHGVLRLTEVYDIIFGSGAKVMIGMFIRNDYANSSPQNPKELFNLRHASLRNAIERIFGVLKKRFKVLTHQVEYPYKIQVRLIKVLCCLHNIIRIVGGDDWFDEQWIRDLKNADSSQSDLSNEVVTSKAITTAQTKQANMMRDDIAEKMWSQY